MKLKQDGKKNEKNDLSKGIINWALIKKITWKKEIVCKLLGIH